MEAATAFTTLVADLSGKPISYVWRGYGSAIFLEFGDLTHRTNRDGTAGHPEGEVSLRIEWSWRIEVDRKILCGSWSEDHTWEGGFALLRGAVVNDVKLFGRLPEVGLSTNEDIHLLSFSTTEGQPQWHLVDHRADPDRWFTVRDGHLHLGDGSEPAH